MIIWAFLLEVNDQSLLGLLVVEHALAHNFTQNI